MTHRPKALQIYDPKVRALVKALYSPVIKWVGALEYPHGWRARVYFSQAFYAKPINIRAKDRADVERQIEEIARSRCQYIET
jgi:hypothetical protein